MYIPTHLISITVEMHTQAKAGEDQTKVVLFREADDQSEGWFTIIEDVPCEIIARLFDLWLNENPQVHFEQVLYNPKRHVRLVSRNVAAFATRLTDEDKQNPYQGLRKLYQEYEQAHNPKGGDTHD